jgi:peptide/nickel transport system substrate-binding protein
MLEDAGWTDTDGDGIRECHGCPNAEEGYVMEAEFAIYPEYGPELELAQQLIAENLADIGIATKLISVEGAVMWDPDGGTEVTGNYDIDMWDDGWPGIYPTDNHLWWFYHSDAHTDYGGYNVMRWYNDEFDAIVYEKLYTLDEDLRMEGFCEIAGILDEELPQILLFSTLEMHGISSRLKGVIPSANDPVTWNIADWTLEE